jgi:MarR family transcriptional regulator, organic hydroperoxide resistance regulator
MQVVLRVFQTAQIFDKAAKRIFSPHGLTSAQFNVLNLLADLKEGLRASDLATSLIVDPSNVTGLLKRMSRDALVVDLESKTDRRQRIVALTPKGRALWSKASRDYEKCLYLLEELVSEKERKLTEEILVRLSTEAAKLAE